MADATTIESMQLTSANNQPNSDSEDASSAGTYGIRPMFQQISASLRNESLNSEWTDINGLTSTGWAGSLSPTHTSVTSFTYQGDQTGYFTVNRRLKALLSTSTIYGYVFSSTYNAGPQNTSVVAVWDSGSLDGTETNIMIGSLNPSFLSVPTQVIATRAFVNGQSQFSGATSGTNTYTVTLTPAPANLAALTNFIVTLFVANGNTTNVTLAPNSLAAKSVLKWANGSLAQLASNDIPANSTVILMYDGTQFVLVSVANQIPQFDGAAGAKGLKGSSSGNTQFTASASLLMLRPASASNVMVLPGFSGGATVDISTAGPILNGRDQAGAFGASATIYVYAIYGAGQTTGLIASASDTAPTLPTNYTNYGYLFSAILTSGNFYASYLEGNNFYYAAQQSVLSSGGSASEANISLAGFVPSNAQTAKLQVEAAIAKTGAGIASGVLTFKLLTGNDFFKINAAFDFPAGTNTLQTDSLLEVPNNIASQNLIYQWTAPSGSPGFAANAWVIGYTVPNNA